jgi:PhoU domain
MSSKVEAAGASRPVRRARIEPQGAGAVAPPIAPSRRIATIEVSRTEPPEHLFRRLLGAYLGGAGEFVVREPVGLGAETREVARAFCERVRQPRVVFEGPTEVRLRDEGEPMGEGPLARKILETGRAVLRFHREAIESWGRVPFLEEGYWADRDDEIDREAWYVQRRLALGDGSREREASLDLWTIARSLERIADHAVTLGSLGPRLVGLPGAETPLRSLRQYHRQAMAHLEGSLEATDDRVANQLLDVGEALLTSGLSLTERLLPAVGEGGMPALSAGAIALALESIRRTVAYSQDIAQVVLDRRLAGT